MENIQIIAPERSGSLYFNYEGTHSIVLMAVADANYNVIYADVGHQGRISDGGVFQHTSQYFPDAEALPSREKLVPFVFVADNAFALSENILRTQTFVQFRSSSPERVFNYRLSRARRIIENVFGITKFRIFLVTLTCIYLHNYLRRNAESKSFYSPPGTFDSEDSDNNLISRSWRKEVKDPNNIPRKAVSEVQQIRDEFREYFMSVQFRGNILIHNT
ncbi:hypothetical protein J437_LFUL019281, partial [Ladona fulva]